MREFLFAAAVIVCTPLALAARAAWKIWQFVNRSEEWPMRVGDDWDGQGRVCAECGRHKVRVSPADWRCPKCDP